MDKRTSIYAIGFALLLTLITVFCIVITNIPRNEKDDYAQNQTNIVSDEFSTSNENIDAINSERMKNAEDLELLKTYLAEVKSIGEVGSFETNMVALKVGETRKITITDSQLGNYWLVCDSDIVKTEWLDNSVAFIITAEKEGICKVGVSTKESGDEEINLVVWCY